MPPALLLPPVLPRGVMLWALKPKPKSQGDPASAWCELGEACAIFTNIYFVCDLEHKIFLCFTARAAAPSPSGLLCCTGEAGAGDEQNRLEANTQPVSQPCPLPPSGGSSPAGSAPVWGWDVQPSQSLVPPPSVHSALCPQVQEARPGLSPQDIALGQCWAEGGGQLRELPSQSSPRWCPPKALVVTGAVCFNASWNALLPLVKRIFVMHFIVSGMAIC